MLLTGLGSLIWNTVFVAGYLLGANWQVVNDYAAYFQYLVIGAVAVVVITFLTRRFRARGTTRLP
ncbi:hypothetical protein [Amycolatopsis sp.]|uniref:hypothetical protein n=1 Tax=Amycolatopsis sp. TaxID=37632 RepID=UPI0039C85C9A